MMLTLAKILIAPVIYLQGRYVRKKVPKLPEPEGPREGCRGQGNTLDLLIIGDSAAAGVGAFNQAHALSGQLVEVLSGDYALNWRLLAKTGHTTRNIIDLLHNQPPQSFDVVVVSVGVNDMTSGLSLEQWLAYQGELVALLNEKFGSPQILLSQIPPMGQFPALPHPLRWYLGRLSSQYNRALSAWVGSQRGCQLLEMDVRMTPELMASDGFHPAPPFYQLWGEAIARKIMHSPNNIQ